MARAYSVFATGDAELGIGPETIAQLTADPSSVRPKDEVLGIPAYYSLGYLRPGAEVSFGTSPRAFGAPGASRSPTPTPSSATHT